MNAKNMEVVNVFQLQNKGVTKRSVKLIPPACPGIINVSALRGRSTTRK